MNSFLLCCEGPNSKIHQFKDRKYDNRGIRHDVHSYIEVGSDNNFQFQRYDEKLVFSVTEIVVNNINYHVDYRDVHFDVDESS